MGSRVRNFKAALHMHYLALSSRRTAMTPLVYTLVYNPTDLYGVRARQQGPWGAHSYHRGKGSPQSDPRAAHAAPRKPQ